MLAIHDTATATSPEETTSQVDELVLAPAEATAELPGLGAVAEQELRWQPLLAAFGSEIASQFLWAATTDTIQTYEHSETFRFVHIDSLTGECLNQTCEVISPESALRHALRPVAQPAAELVEELVSMPAVELVVAAEIMETTEAADSIEVAAFEPELHAFMRKTDAPGISDLSLAWPAGPFAIESVGVENQLIPRKRQWLSRLLAWSEPLVTRKQEVVSLQTEASHEPSLSTYTRRTSML